MVQGYKDDMRTYSYFTKLVKTTVLFRDIVFSQIFDRVGVVHSFERPLGDLKSGIQFLDKMTER